MSGFTGASQGQQIQKRQDYRHLKVNLGFLRSAIAAGAGKESICSYKTPYWPGSRLTGDMAADGPYQQASRPYYRLNLTPGVNSRLGYQGITRDVNNSPLLGATVKLFRTSDDSKVTPDVVSDLNTGEYVISTPYYEQHWIKVAKAGSPPVQGVSVDSILPNV